MDDGTAVDRQKLEDRYSLLRRMNLPWDQFYACLLLLATQWVKIDLDRAISLICEVPDTYLECEMPEALRAIEGFRENLLELAKGIGPAVLSDEDEQVADLLALAESSGRPEGLS